VTWNGMLQDTVVFNKCETEGVTKVYNKRITHYSLRQWIR